MTRHFDEFLTLLLSFDIVLLSCSRLFRVCLVYKQDNIGHDMIGLNKTKRHKMGFMKNSEGQSGKKKFINFVLDKVVSWVVGLKCTLVSSCLTRPVLSYPMYQMHP